MSQNHVPSEALQPEDTRVGYSVSHSDVALASSKRTTVLFFINTGCVKGGLHEEAGRNGQGNVSYHHPTLCTQSVSLLLDVHICISIAELVVIVSSPNINRKIVRKQFLFTIFQSWKTRWFVLKDNFLSYYTRHEVSFRGPICLRGECLASWCAQVRMLNLSVLLSCLASGISKGPSSAQNRTCKLCTYR